MSGEKHAFPGCGGRGHLNRRTLIRSAAGLGAAAWLTPVARLLAREDEEKRDGPAKSVIVLWLQGGPSQLETFDPHPGTMVAGGTNAIPTAAPGIQLAEGLERLAEQMNSVALVRSVVSKEGDHERATYNVKTGFRPDPTLVHPSLGSVVCHQLHDELDIPRHVSIYPHQWPARGGYLGDQYDAFKVYDPRGQVNDITPRVPKERFDRRVHDLANVVEREFARGRLKALDQQKTLHLQSVLHAQRMMSSAQLDAFDVTKEAASLQADYGHTDFGRGCLAAARLIEVGVRCVEVTLSGWDSHANNHATQRAQVEILDPAFAALLKDLKRRGLFQRTVVLCGGEFGRTPAINALDGRDHWPHGFSIALAGGGIRAGQVVGETSAELPEKGQDRSKYVVDPRPVEDIHATVLRALQINFQQELQTPVGRPMVISKGAVIQELLS